MSLDELLTRELGVLDERGLRRRFRSVETPQRAIIELDGRRVLNFSANNYLGLADSDALRTAAERGIEADGVGSGASRLIAGNLRSHRRLEGALAHFHQTEAALLFTSGYQANVGVLSALAGPEDAIFSDELNHASIIDGCRLSRAQVHVFAHRDIADLHRKLVRVQARRRFIVTDTIFSMDGDLAPLAELRRLADRADAFLIIDEAHATGVVGPRGRGLAAELNITADVHIATLSKALGTFGAYVAGKQALVDYLANRARSFIFTTALPPSIAAAAATAVELVASSVGDVLRSRLHRLIEHFTHGLIDRGLLPDGAGLTPIFPILIGDEQRALAATESLLQQGIYAQAIRPPTVPRGTSRLRFALMATHQLDDVTRALGALDTLVREGILRRAA